MYNIFKKKKIMTSIIARVVSQTDTFDVNTKDGVKPKCYIYLKEVNGDYADDFYCSMLGPMATCKYAEGDVVNVSLKMRTYESNGQHHQGIEVRDIVKLNGSY